MHHRPSGPSSVAALLRRWRRDAGRLRLTVPAAVVLVAVVLAAVVAVPALPAGRGAADAPALHDVAEASASGPLAHEGAGIGAPMRQNDADGSAPATTDRLLEPADRDVLHKVKQAGLWEMPVGTWAAERGESPRVREIGRLIAAEHAELDAIVHDAAAQLGVELPVEPTAEQQDWMAEIEEQQGAAFDERAVFLLRQAHGKVLPVLAQVRAATENAVVRDFTAEAMTFVQRHIEYLESTGLVDYVALPDPAALGSDDWRSHAMTFVVFAMLAALFTALVLVAGRAVADRARNRVPTPRARVRGHHARS